MRHMLLPQFMAQLMTMVLLVSGLLIVLMSIFGRFISSYQQFYFLLSPGYRSRVDLLDVDHNLFAHLTWESSIVSDGNWGCSLNVDLVVCSLHHNTAMDLMVVNMDGSNAHWLTENGYNITPAWSPDGRLIAFSVLLGSKPGIYVMDTDGRNPRRLTSNGAYPAWSPDGRYIAYQVPSDGNRQIYVMDADGGNPRLLTSNQEDSYSPAWSPDGQHIAFVSERDGRIYTMDADGGNRRLLVKVINNAFSPVWSSDGKRIIFQAGTESGIATNFICIVDADGSHLRWLMHYNPRLHNPIWRTP